METQRSPNQAGSGERLPGTGLSFHRITNPLPQRVAAGDSFHSELQRTQETLRGESRNHRPLPRTRREERRDQETRTERSETRSRPERRETDQERRIERSDFAADRRAPDPASADTRSVHDDASRLTAPGDPSAARIGGDPVEAIDPRRGRGEPVRELPPARVDERRTRLPDAGLARALPADSRPTTRREHVERGPEEGSPLQPARHEQVRAQSRAAATPAPGRGTEQAEQRRAEDVLRQFRNLLHPALRSATLQLEPRELGRLSIRVAMHEGRVSAQVRAERPETLDLLRKHLPELQAALAGAGIQTESFTLELGTGERGDRPTADARPAAPARGNEFESRLAERPPVAGAERGTRALDTWA
jgi:Flagellar hook-length control protein FliK